MAVREAFQEALLHYEAGRFEQALVHCRAAQGKDRYNPNVLGLLGVLEQACGRPEAAVEALRKATSLAPMNAQLQFFLAEAFRATDRLDDAISAYGKTLGLNPGFAVAWQNLCGVYMVQGKWEAALPAGEQFARLAPDRAEAHGQLARIHEQLGRPDQAMACLERALRLKPGDPQMLEQAGDLLLRAGRSMEASIQYKKLLTLQPDNVTALQRLALALDEAGALDEAVKAYRGVLRVAPDEASAHHDLAVVLSQQGRLDEAVESCRRALELRGDFSLSHMTMGIIRSYQGLSQEAVQAFRAAVATDPTNRLAHSNLCYATLYMAGNDGEAAAAERRRWDAAHQALAPCAAWPNDRDPERRLRVGLVSGDFRNHSVAYFVEPILEARDRQSLEVLCYADVANSDTVTLRMRGLADGWREIKGISDAHVAETVQRDGIDILIDLGGHTGERLGVFALRPAPVQISYLGDQATSGLAVMDYRLTDPIADPPGMTESFYSERLLRLPEVFACYRPPEEAAGVTAARAEGSVTFGCFTNLSKVSPATIALWSAVLRQVPDSRMVLKAKMDEGVRRHFTRAFQEQGIASERLVLAGWSGMTQYLQELAALDILLDTFPFNGHTGTCHALWMGTPAVSLYGSTYVSRMGLSVLTNVGLPELAVATEAAYVEAAVALARDPGRLRSLQATLRQRVAGSPLMDASRFCRNFERVCRDAWRVWAERGGR